MYLPAFRSAVEAGAATVMAGFNDVNGIPLSANRRLLTDVLRRQMGFDGFVVSDWDAIRQMTAFSGFAADKKGDMVEVSIENTGAGIAPEALPFVFERFYKEDRSRGMNTRGSGLGLHICKVLINLSGGQIHAESEEGQWCRFVFTLPAAKA